MQISLFVIYGSILAQRRLLGYASRNSASFLPKWISLVRYLAWSPPIYQCFTIARSYELGNYSKLDSLQEALNSFQYTVQRQQKAFRKSLTTFNTRCFLWKLDVGKGQNYVSNRRYATYASVWAQANGEGKVKFSSYFLPHPVVPKLLKNAPLGFQNWFSKICCRTQAFQWSDDFMWLL